MDTKALIQQFVIVDECGEVHDTFKTEEEAKAGLLVCEKHMDVTVLLTDGTCVDAEYRVVELLLSDSGQVRVWANQLSTTVAGRYLKGIHRQSCPF